MLKIKPLILTLLIYKFVFCSIDFLFQTFPAAESSLNSKPQSTHEIGFT